MGLNFKSIDLKKNKKKTKWCGPLELNLEVLEEDHLIPSMSILENLIGKKSSLHSISGAQGIGFYERDSQLISYKNRRIILENLGTLDNHADYHMILQPIGSFWHSRP